jgi:hypothetical protein
VTSEEHEQLVWTLMHDIFDALGDEQREHFTADLERRLYPSELVAELRAAEHLVEGLCVAAEGVNFVSLLVANDCRERVRRALRYVEQAEA